MNDKKKRFVNARELYKWLKVGKFFANWIKDRIKKYDFVEGKDYFITVANSGNGVRKRADGILIDEKTGKVIPKEYILTIDMAKEIAMYEEILFIIGSFETGLAGELEKKYKKKQLIDYKKEFTNEDLRLLLGNRDN
ncbi:MAG: antA/AntB antirepressor family protein [Candidatus Pacebacteria bacterium]|nr:antA/AntB antirepressor family protein [Candidatus Paceibacterota bacterium]